MSRREWTLADYQVAALYLISGALIGLVGVVGWVGINLITVLGGHWHFIWEATR